jgi:hypothetical protein
MRGEHFLSRRRFLQAGLVVGCGLYFPGIALAAPAMDPAEQARRVAEFRSMCGGIEQCLVPRLGKDAARDAAMDCAARFEELLPSLPFIGGTANRNQENLIQAAWLIAMSKAVKAGGLAAADAGRILYDLCERELAATPEKDLLTRGAAYFSPESYASLRAWAEETQKRRYPGDWVATAVFGNGEDFDVGHDYAQCGAVLLGRAHGEADVIRYFCLNDFLFSRYEGTGLRRVHTLAQGDPLCDFRYKRGRTVTQSWETEVPRFPASTVKT